MADFSGRVIAEARERGLVEERVSLRTCFWLWMALLVAVVLLAIAAIGVLPGVLAYFVLAQLVLMLRGERATEAGSRLVPMYRALAADAQTDGAGRIDRQVAYVAALGNGSERSPVAPQDRRDVW